MQRFASLDDLSSALGEATKWRRVADAVQGADRSMPEVTFSLGDSLTYRRTSGLECPEFTRHRRYLELRYVLAGTAAVEIAPVVALLPVDDYSDLTDRQHFAGSGERYDLTEGEFVVVGVAEAIRDVAVEGQVMVLRVTVEG